MNRIATLLEMEAEHAKALEHIRALIDLERPKASNGTPKSTKKEPTSENVEPGSNGHGDLAGLSQVAAAAKIFGENENKALSAEALVIAMKKRGLTVPSVKSLYNNLSGSNRFQKPERGKFNLKTTS
jgi:hypothetical protein